MRYAGTVLILVVVVVILATGCTTQEPAHPQSQTYTREICTGIPANMEFHPSSLTRTWYIRSMVIDHVPTAPLPLTGITIQFDANGNFSGYDSCNHYAGRWKADKRHISIGGLSSEGLLCHDPRGVMEQEEQYFAILRNATDYVVNGEDMAICDGSGKNRLIYKQVFF